MESLDRTDEFLAALGIEPAERERLKRDIAAAARGASPRWLGVSDDELAEIVRWGALAHQRLSDLWADAVKDCERRGVDW